MSPGRQGEFIHSRVLRWERGPLLPRPIQRHTVRGQKGSGGLFQPKGLKGRKLGAENSQDSALRWVSNLRCVSGEVGKQPELTAPGRRRLQRSPGEAGTTCFARAPAAKAQARPQGSGPAPSRPSPGPTCRRGRATRGAPPPAEKPGAAEPWEGRRGRRRGSPPQIISIRRSRETGRLRAPSPVPSGVTRVGPGSRRGRGSEVEKGGNGAREGSGDPRALLIASPLPSVGQEPLGARLSRGAHGGGLSRLVNRRETGSAGSASQPLPARADSRPPEPRAQARGEKGRPARSLHLLLRMASPTTRLGLNAPVYRWTDSEVPQIRGEAAREARALASSIRSPQPQCAGCFAKCNRKTIKRHPHLPRP